MRRSTLPPGLPRSSGAAKLLASNADNFQLVYSSRPDQMYPFNQYPKFSMYMLVSSTLVEMLKEHEDRRLFYYAEPAQTLLSAGEDTYEAYEGVDPVAESSEIVNAYMRAAARNSIIGIWKPRSESRSYASAMRNCSSFLPKQPCANGLRVKVPRAITSRASALRWNSRQPTRRSSISTA